MAIAFSKTGICFRAGRYRSWPLNFPSVLDFAKIGKYSGRRIEKVAPELLKKYFVQDKNDPEYYDVNQEVRSLVSFKYLNLFKDAFPQNCDVIFCRNVMIYFDREHQRTLVGNFYKAVNKQAGYFFIGHSETLHAISEDFVYSKIMDSPVYVPKDCAADLAK
jgi:chemotaxis protein methyltransferase CheR